MGTLAPAQNYTHVLQVVSGSNAMHDLQFNAAPHGSATFNRGALVSLDSSGLLVSGCGAKAMPMWALNGTSDYDANSDVGNTAGGKINCFVATGGFEIFTTEFVTTSTYARNALLTAGTAGDAGKIEVAGAKYNDAVIVGCVSKGVSTSLYDQPLLTFWSMFLPAVSLARASSSSSVSSLSSSSVSSSSVSSSSVSSSSVSSSSVSSSSVSSSSAS